MKYERLTEKAENGKPYFDGCLRCDLEGDCGLCPYWESGLERLAELEDKIEQGTLIELPCKVGDTVYRITQSYRSAEQVTPYIVKEIIINKKDVSYLTIALKGKQSITCKVKLETVFLTREEAEKRLKELQE